MAKRTPEQYNWEKLEFNENLLPDTLFTYGRGGQRIEYFTVHHMIILDAGTKNDSPLQACKNVWLRGRMASAHYGVSGDFVDQYVWDDNTAWSNASVYSNQRSISVEHANKTLDEPGWENDYLIDEKTFFTGARLIAHGHHLYNLKPQFGVTVRKHSEFTATACPGPYFDRNFRRYFDLMHDIYNSVGRGEPVAPVPTNPTHSSSLPGKLDIAGIAQEVILGVWGNGQARVNKLLASGYNPIEVQRFVNDILSGKVAKDIETIAWEVIRGSWGNGEERLNRLRSAGFDPREVQSRVNALLR